MNVKPLGDKLVIKLLEAEEKTKSGIVLPDTAKEKPQQGKVLAVGSGKLMDNGERIPLDVQIGDKIIFSKFAGTELKMDGEEYLILSERDVLAII